MTKSNAYIVAVTKAGPSWNAPACYSSWKGAIFDPVKEELDFDESLPSNTSHG